MPSVTERVHEVLRAHGPLSRRELHERLSEVSSREIDTALEHLHSTGTLTFEEGRYGLSDEESV